MTTLSHVPPEVLQCILAYSCHSIPESVRLRRVCRKFHEALDDARIWSSLFSHRWSIRTGTTMIAEACKDGGRVLGAPGVEFVTTPSSLLNCLQVDHETVSAWMSPRQNLHVEDMEFVTGRRFAGERFHPLTSSGPEPEICRRDLYQMIHDKIPEFGGGVEIGLKIRAMDPCVLLGDYGRIFVTLKGYRERFYHVFFEKSDGDGEEDDDEGVALKSEYLGHLLSSQDPDPDPVFVFGPEMIECDRLRHLFVRKLRLWAVDGCFDGEENAPFFDWVMMWLLVILDHRFLLFDFTVGSHPSEEFIRMFGDEDAVMRKLDEGEGEEAPIPQDEWGEELEKLKRLTRSMITDGDRMESLDQEFSPKKNVVFDNPQSLSSPCLFQRRLYGIVETRRYYRNRVLFVGEFVITRDGFDLVLQKLEGWSAGQMPARPLQQSRVSRCTIS